MLKAKKSDLDINAYLVDLPWWYTALKWFVPLGVALMTALFFGAMTTGFIGVPALLHGLSSLPVLYSNLTAIGAFTLLSTIMIMSSVVVGMGLSLLTRAALLSVSEAYHAHNYQNAITVFRLTAAHTNKEISKIIQERDDFVVEKTRAVQELQKQLRQQKAVKPVVISSAARQVVGEETDVVGTADVDLLDQAANEARDRVSDSGVPVSASGLKIKTQ